MGRSWWRIRRRRCESLYNVRGQCDEWLYDYNLTEITNYVVLFLFLFFRIKLLNYISFLTKVSKFETVVLVFNIVPIHGF
jgi:hypothetical protein